MLSSYTKGAYGGNNHHLVFTRVIPINQKYVVGFEPTNGAFAEHSVTTSPYVQNPQRKGRLCRKNLKGGLQSRKKKCSTPLLPMVGGNYRCTRISISHRNIFVNCVQSNENRFCFIIILDCVS